MSRTVQFRLVVWLFINTGWNDKIVALEKTSWFHFCLMKTGFLFFVADYLLVGQLCTNPKSDRSLLSCLKVTQCSTSEIGDAPLYNSCSLSIQLSTDSQNANPDGSTLEGTAQRIGRPFGGGGAEAQGWGHRQEDPDQGVYRKGPGNHWWNSPAVWWFPGAIRWPVADPGCGNRTRRRPTSPKRPRLGFRRSATTLYPSLTAPFLPRPETVELLRLVIRREHHQHDLPQHQSLPVRRHPPSSRRCLWKRHAPSSVSRWWLRLKAATLNWCQLYYIIKLPELIFFNKSFKIKL